MKIEFLDYKSEEIKLIRLYDFNLPEANQFKQIIKILLVKGAINLDKCDFILPVDGIEFKLQVSNKDFGITRINPKNSLKFNCSLSKKTWENVLELIEPFCSDDSTYIGEKYQWLINVASIDIEFLFSPTGAW